MSSIKQMILKSVFGLALAKSAMATFSFNTSYNDPMNGHFGNPAEQLRTMGASQSCLDAYVANIDCDPLLFNFTYLPSEKYYTKDNLDKACQKTCEVALASWIVKTWPICGSSSEPSEIQALFTGTGNENVTMTHYYWGYCTQDLKNGTYCLTENDPVYLDVNSTYTQQEKDVACADTCFTQDSASLWSTYSAIGETSTINIANVKDVCPNVDTSNYEILKPLAAIAAESSTSSSSASPSGTSTSSASSNPSSTSPSSSTVSGTPSSSATQSSGAPAVTSSSTPNAANGQGTSFLMVLPLLLLGL